MKKLLILSLLILTSYLVDTGNAADTTYSKIKIKKKKKDSGSSSGWSSSSEKDDNAECFSSCVGDLVTSMFEKTPEEEAEAAARRAERREARRQERAQQRQLAEKTHIGTLDNPYFDTPLHLMTGINLGGGFFSEEVGQGFTVGVPLSFNIHPTQSIAFRLYTEYALEGTSMNVDFERDIFVNGTPSGTQEFITDEYQSFLMPLRFDILLFPPLHQRGFFFATGFGTRFSYDKVRGTLKSPSGEESHEVDFKDWNLTVHVGIGGYLEKVAIELGYDYTPLRNEASVFAPSDNSSARHAVKFGVTLSIF